MILKPEEIVYNGPALSLIAPCESGYLGVLADHAPLVANIIPGKVTVKLAGKDPLIVDVEGKGFLEVLNNNVSLILNRAHA